nr:hypothetical protein [Streptomyces anulatus]
MDCVDTLYIADHNNHRIRRITSATMAGRPESGTVVSWANVRSRLRMGVLRESLKDGAEIHQSLPSPRAHQQWRLIPVGSVTGRHPEGLRDREPQQRSASPRRHQRPRGDQAARGTGRPPGPAVAVDSRRPPRPGDLLRLGRLPRSATPGLATYGRPQEHCVTPTVPGACPAGWLGPSRGLAPSVHGARPWTAPSLPRVRICVSRPESRPSPADSSRFTFWAGDVL